MPSSKQKLTKTQRFILETMVAHEGLAYFGAGDRRGTRVASVSELTGIPKVIAYQTPERFLRVRKLIEPAGGNYNPNTYRITSAGRDAL